MVLPCRRFILIIRVDGNFAEAESMRAREGAVVRRVACPHHQWARHGGCAPCWCPVPGGIAKQQLAMREACRCATRAVTCQRKSFNSIRSAGGVRAVSKSARSGHRNWPCFCTEATEVRAVAYDEPLQVPA